MFAKKLFRVFLVLFLALLPLVIFLPYQELTKLPTSIDIGSGPEKGLYDPFCEDLERRIEANTDVEVVITKTNGSLENLKLLREGKIDFALYQPGTEESTQGNKDRPEPGNVRFVANLYSQPAHIFVRSTGPKFESKNGTPLRDWMLDKKVAIGLKDSGDRAMSTYLLRHLGLTEKQIFVMYQDVAADEYYSMVKKGFEDGSLDAAIITMGENASIFGELARSVNCELADIPNRDALVRKHHFLSPYTIPAGMYGNPPNALPKKDIHTVASGAQLLTHKGVSSSAVAAITRIVLEKRYARDNEFRELLDDTNFEFAKMKPDFPLHDYARSVYEPEFDITLLETWDAAYSLVASGFILALFAFRWYSNRREKQNEHKIDRYIRMLLNIERRQMLGHDVATLDQLQQYQKLLDEVTELRQEALCEFTAHDLTEDRGTECFINMCHALSNKINAKLTRQSTELMMQEIIIKSDRSAQVATDDSKRKNELRGNSDSVK